MKVLGFYSELWPSSPEATSSIHSFVADAPQPNESEIASYLRSGHMLFASMGVVDDVLGSGENIMGGGSMSPDGEWVWRGDLWFYVSRHHAVLPEESGPGPSLWDTFSSRCRAGASRGPSGEPRLSGLVSGNRPGGPYLRLTMAPHHTPTTPKKNAGRRA